VATLKQLEQKVTQKTVKRDRLKQELDGVTDPKSPKRKRLQEELKQTNNALQVLKEQLKQAKGTAKTVKA